MPKEVQEQVFLASTLIADGLGRLLQTEDNAEHELPGRGSRLSKRLPVG